MDRGQREHRILVTNTIHHPRTSCVWINHIYGSIMPFRTPTESELRNEFADMLTLYAEKGQKALESYILGKGRLEMQHMIAYLFVRAASAEIENMRLVDKLKEEINGTNQPQHTG